MVILYRLGVWFYWLVIQLLRPFNQKARKFSDGRKDWRDQLVQAFQGNQREVVWFHAASLGEFEQGRPVIESLKQGKPEIKVLLSFFSPSGFEIRKNYEYADWVIYLPIDTPGNARFFVDTVKPKMAIFIKYEFWYFYLRELVGRQISTLVISCVFRENQLFFHWSNGYYRKVLKRLNHYFVQDEQSEKLIRGIGAQHVSVSGDTRFDRVLDIASAAKKIEIVENFKGSSRVMVLGSSWDSDIAIIGDFVKKYQVDIKFIIAPHKIDESEIMSLENEFDNTIRYSMAEGKDLSSFQILIVDNMGMLSSLYRYGDFAFIGGAFRGALHNTLEAAVYGIPVCFGEHSNNQKFKEAVGLAETSGGFTFSTSEQLENWFLGLLDDDLAYQRSCREAGDFVKERAGATPQVVKKLVEFL